MHLHGVSKVGKIRGRLCRMVPYLTKVGVITTVHSPLLKLSRITRQTRPSTTIRNTSYSIWRASPYEYLFLSTPSYHTTLRNTPYSMPDVSIFRFATHAKIGIAHGTLPHEHHSAPVRRITQRTLQTPQRRSTRLSGILRTACQTSPFSVSQ